MTTDKRPADIRQLNLRMPVALHSALTSAAAARGMTLASYLKFLASEQLHKERKHA